MNIWVLILGIVSVHSIWHNIMANINIMNNIISLNYNINKI